MKKIIVKVGTSALTKGTEELSRRAILKLVQEIAELSDQGFELALVSSGAVATGKALLNGGVSKQWLLSRPIYASIGQVKLMQVWAELFSLFEQRVAQVLLTKEDFSDSKRDVTKETLSGLLSHGIIPIINENDTISSKEGRIGNNDVLAALVAKLIQADTLILLTDQEGLYTADPRFDPNAQLISTIEEIDEAVFKVAGGSSTQLGTGGMITKIIAAEIAVNAGIQTIIASSSRPNILTDLVHGQKLGTLFLEKGEKV